VTGRPVTDVVGERLLNTLVLATVTAVVVVGEQHAAERLVLRPHPKDVDMSLNATGDRWTPR
jgi:hypothetical protein